MSRFVLLLLFAVPVACRPEMGAVEMGAAEMQLEQPRQAAKTEDADKPSKEIAMTTPVQTGLPLIDQAKPAKIETATFALG